MTPLDDERAGQWDSVNRSIVIAKLVSAMVHDARNTLQGIAGTAELVVTTLGPEQAKQAERVHGILVKCLSLGERLETFRSMQEPAPVQLANHDLARICGRAIELRQASWGPRQISGAVSIGPGVIVQGDATGLLRLLLNLLLNSERSLGEAGGGQISFAASVGAGVVRLVIEDTGAGVSAANEPHLFHLLGSDGLLATGLWTAARLAEFSGANLTWLGPEGRRAAFELRLRSGSGG